MNNKSFKLSGTGFTGGWPIFMGGLAVSAGFAGYTGLALRFSVDQVFNSKLIIGVHPCVDQC